MWEYVCSLSYPAFNAHATYCYLWSVRLYNSVLQYLLNGTIFGKKSLNTKCVFWFPLQLLSEAFLILRRTERDMIKMYIGLHVKYPLFLSDFNEIWIFSIYFEKYKNIKFHEYPSSVNGVVPWGQTDKQTDGHTYIYIYDKANSRFWEFCERA